MDFDWIISDTHFGHDGILKYEPGRVDRMRKDRHRNHATWLVTRWNAVVRPDDHVLHLGDFAFKDEAERVLRRLNGRITLLLGNHDKPEKMRELAASSGGKLKVVEGIDGQPCDNPHVSALTANLADRKVFFCHYPLLTAEPHVRGRIAEAHAIMQEAFIDGGFEVCVHGHLHSKDEQIDPRHEINVSFERIGFAPLAWDILGEWVKAPHLRTRKT
ncbi:hypothetical protein D6833_07750 [Candidatus Parcubacteria bacterium]|nr:MAG: hypothetical protein D6833_07750 [Candidatus Parcubacteria bacterium]